jgi:hypothetical protein
MTPSFEYTVPDSPYRFVIMDRNVLIKKYGTMAVLLTLLVVMNPELRAFLLMANVVGVDLMVFRDNSWPLTRRRARGRRSAGLHECLSS